MYTVFALGHKCSAQSWIVSSALRRSKARSASADRPACLVILQHAHTAYCPCNVQQKHSKFTICYTYNHPYMGLSEAICSDIFKARIVRRDLLVAGCRAVPGMSPADYREALYSTWMTGQPWGMQLINCDSDEEDVSGQEVQQNLGTSLETFLRLLRQHSATCLDRVASRCLTVWHTLVQRKVHNCILTVCPITQSRTVRSAQQL